MVKPKKRIKRAQRTVPSHQRRSWPGVVVVAAALLLTGGGVLLWPRGNQLDVTPQVTGAPRVAVAEEALDYGDVKLNTPIETVFHVRNVGDQPLKILGEPQVELVQGC